MKLITVIPLSRGIYKESLTYFSAQDIPVGTIVSVPLRKKTIDALVTHTEQLLKSKVNIKSANFSLKKITQVKGPSPFSVAFLKTCTKASKYFVSTTGQILNSLIPASFLKSDLRIPLSPSLLGRGEIEGGESNKRKFVLQAPWEKRLAFYKKFIQESFAKKESIFFCLPTIYDIETFAEILQKGIEDYTFVFHSKLPSKKQIEQYNTLRMGHMPVLIIATTAYLSIPINNIGTIIVEKESSNAYKTIGRPFLDLRIFAEIFSQETNAKLIFGDTFLRLETIWRHQQGELGKAVPLKFQMPKETEIQIVDMRKGRENIPVGERSSAKEKFEVFSAEVKDTIKKIIENGERMFLFTLRKGLAPVTICNDCGTALLCERCDIPLILMAGSPPSKGRMFMCSKCKNQTSAKVICAQCGSWNLIPLGIGTQGVLEEAKKEFPKVHTFRIDQVFIKTRKQAEKTIKEFYETPGSILVGTEMALGYIDKKIDNSAVVSFDSLWSIPGFRINERVLQLLSKLTSLTEKKLLIQTRNPEVNVLRYWQSGNLSKFYQEELLERKKFNYPPYIILILIRHAGKREDYIKIKKYFDNNFTLYQPDVFRAFTSKIKGKYMTNILFKIPREKWNLDSIDEALLQKLRALPPTYIIQVNPEDLL